MKLLPREVVEPVLLLCEDVATPRALTVSLMVRNGEWDQLADLRCDPSRYANAGHYRMDAIVTDLLRKLEDLPTTLDRRKAAEEAFWEGERMCFRANERLARYLVKPQIDQGDVVWKVILHARKN